MFAFRARFLRKWTPRRATWVALFLVVPLGLVRPGAHGWGEVLQVSLPITGLVCATVSGNMPGYLMRYAATWTTVKATKRVLGDAPINQRPNGKSRGFPSTHTASAVFGASALVNSCLDNAPLLKTGIVVAAGFAGGSRIETGHHTIWQVLAGAFVALFYERAFRRGSRERRTLARFWDRTHPFREKSWQRVRRGLSVRYTALQGRYARFSRNTTGTIMLKSGRKQR